MSDARRGHLKTILAFIWPAKRPDLKLRVAIGLVLMVLGKVATIYVPILLGRTVDSLNPAPNLVLVVPVALILAYGTARVLSLAFSELRDAIFAKVAQHAMRQNALATFEHLHRLSLRFHLERQTGGLSRAIERGVKAIEFLLFFLVFAVGPTLLELLFVCGVFWVSFGFYYALVTLVTVGFYITYTFSITEWRLKLRRQMNESDQAAATKAVDSLLNYETVKYFNNEGHETRRYDQALAAYEKAAVKNRTSLSLLNVGQAFVIATGVTAVMLLAAQGVTDKALSVGDFVLANTFLIQLYVPLNFLGTVYREIKQSLADLERMSELMAEKVEVADAPAAKDLQVSQGEIVFDQVGFAYDERRQILSDISFTLPAGKTLALVGTTGSGKSTIARLLFRFYDVTQGRILIDGQDIRQVTQSSLRKAIGIVPQDCVLFNDTIYYNIAYGRPDASREEIEHVAEIARIADFVKQLPDGWETKVGERGLKLSGGEKQRVAIARALLKDPPIMIFDEATSALDSTTERLLQESLAGAQKKRTSIVIAHRLSTIVEADEILVFEQGRIVERGRHRDLVALDGTYALLWTRQQSEREEAA